jgi:hypothetical protein
LGRGVPDWFRGAPDVFDFTEPLSLTAASLFSGHPLFAIDRLELGKPLPDMLSSGWIEE